MLRTFVCAVLALGLCAGLALTADKGKAKAGRVRAFRGVVKMFNPEEGTLTVTVKSKGQQKDREVKLSDVTRVLIHSGTDVTPVAKSAVKRDQLKEGTRVRVRMEGDKVLEVQVNPPARRRTPKPGKE